MKYDDRTDLDAVKEVHADPESHPVLPVAYKDKIIVAQNNKLIEMSRHQAREFLNQLTDILNRGVAE